MMHAFNGTKISFFNDNLILLVCTNKRNAQVRKYYLLYMNFQVHFILILKLYMGFYCKFNKTFYAARIKYGVNPIYMYRS